VFGCETSELITADIHLGGKFAAKFFTDTKSKDRNETVIKVMFSG
jgi:hypothetical protein